MRRLLTWSIAVAIAGAATDASATCMRTGKRRAVCSAPDGESYVIRIDAPEPEVRTAKHTSARALPDRELARFIALWSMRTPL
ncbi:MAG TPA: hypothetical protein VG755_22745 [Nannocystaceae bacterium]|nr:hypothetical protein [Nannocystaceae bacterium]